MTFFIIFIVVLVFLAIAVERAKEVREEIVDEALERGDRDKADIIENMSEEEIIENYEDRL